VDDAILVVVVVVIGGDGEQRDQVASQFLTNVLRNCDRPTQKML
jgi:hypothetical protein